MQVSKIGINLIKSFEGYSDKAYPDPGTGGRPYTIGYGTTKIDGKPVELGMTCTKEQAEEWLMDEVNELAIPSILKSVKVDLTQNKIDALASFIYNCGVGNFEKSTLLKKVNTGDFEAASLEFVKWNRAAGKIMAGLTRRREAERDLFNNDPM